MSKQLYIIVAKQKGTGEQIYYAWDSDCLSYWSSFMENAYIFSKEPDFFNVIADSPNYMLGCATNIEIREVTMTISDKPIKKIIIDDGEN